MKLPMPNAKMRSQICECEKTKSLRRHSIDLKTVEKNEVEA